MPMIKKQHIYLFGALVFIILVIGFSINPDNNNHENMLQVESSSFNVPGGWGYNILVGHKIFIHQANIPALSGNKAFTSREDAEKTANLVIQKIVNKKVPSVTVNELDSLHIRY
jgi:Domain of unknown function (DUF4907)